MFSERTAGESYYFIGIGGVSMSALALYLKEQGHAVRGSDAVSGDKIARLRAAGIPVSIGESEEITESTVVYTGAVEKTHPQLSAAIRAGKRLVTRAELLGRIAEEFPHVLSVAGCHGKTTASCMLSHIFYRSGRQFTSHIGGDDLLLGNYFSRGREYFITEACEFKRSFLALHSEIAVILNCDLDHTDCYKSGEELFSAYTAFAEQAERVVVNSDDLRARRIPHALDFGLYSGEIRAADIRAFGERFAFTVTEGDMPVVRVTLNVPGKVHIYNALAAYAAARLCGFSGEEMKEGLESFQGVRRRFERVGELNGVPVICDYAHHPREIAAALETARKLCTGTVRVVFQPHTYTRTRDLLQDFVAVLRRAERPILYKTYSAREKFDLAGSAVQISGRIEGATYVQSPEQLKRALGEAAKGDLILVLGAGDIYDIVRSIL